MNIYCFATFTFIHITMADIEIIGELSFDVQSIGANWNERVKEDNIGGIKGDNNMTIDVKEEYIETANGEDVSEFELLRERNARNKSTAVGRGRMERKKTTRKLEECLYQYPDKKLMEAILSDMMNQLTKIFIRASDYIMGREARRFGKRYKVINKKIESGFFEDAFNLMSKEYKQSVDTAAEEEKYSNHDPCHHQTEIKQIWRNLLEHAKGILKRAALRCVSDFLKVRNRSDDTRTKEKLGQLLLREIKEVRSNQIKLLCDEFKLCYKDLLL